MHALFCDGLGTLGPVLALLSSKVDRLGDLAAIELHDKQVVIVGLACGRSKRRGISVKGSIPGYTRHVLSIHLAAIFFWPVVQEFVHKLSLAHHRLVRLEASVKGARDCAYLVSLLSHLEGSRSFLAHFVRHLVQLSQRGDVAGLHAERLSSALVLLQSSLGF